MPNHLLSTDVPEEVARPRPCWCEGSRSFPVECVVRGYLAGSGWKEYQQSRCRLRHRAAGRAARVGPAAGADLHPGHQGRARRPRREHRLRAAPPRSSATAPREELRRLSLELYARGGRARRERRASSSPTPSSSSAATSGGEILLIDEVLTPDSSRFWPADQYEPGRGQPPSTSSSCATGRRAPAGTTPPGPELPADVVEATRAKYVEAYERIAGQPFERWLDS